MACTKNTVRTGVGHATVYVCVSSTSSRVNVSLEGQAGENIAIHTYAQFILEEANQYDAWIPVATKNAGLWDDSTVGKLHGYLSESSPTGTIQRVVVKFFTNSNYTGQWATASSNAFER